MSSNVWFLRSGATTSSSWTIAESTWSPAFERRSRKRGRRFAICRSTRPTSTRSSCPTANSKRCCARLPRAPFRVSTAQFVRSYRKSVLGNAPTTSPMPAMFPYDREPLLARRAGRLASGQKLGNFVAPCLDPIGKLPRVLGNEGRGCVVVHNGFQSVCSIAQHALGRAADLVLGARDKRGNRAGTIRGVRVIEGIGEPPQRSEERRVGKECRSR